jgi:hypothetical protein
MIHFLKHVNLIFLTSIQLLLGAFWLSAAFAQDVQWRTLKNGDLHFAFYKEFHFPAPPVKKEIKPSIGPTRFAARFFGDHLVFINGLDRRLMAVHQHTGKLRVINIDSLVPGVGNKTRLLQSNDKAGLLLIAPQYFTGMFLDRNFNLVTYVPRSVHSFWHTYRIMDDGTVVGWVGEMDQRPKDPDFHFEKFNWRDGKTVSFGHEPITNTHRIDYYHTSTEVKLAFSLSYMFKTTGTSPKIKVWDWRNQRYAKAHLELDRRFYVPFDTSVVIPPQSVLDKMTLEDAIAFFEPIKANHTYIADARVITMHQKAYLVVLYQTRAYERHTTFKESAALLDYLAVNKDKWLRKGIVEVFDLSHVAFEQAGTYKADAIFEVSIKGKRVYKPTSTENLGLFGDITDNGELVFLKAQKSDTLFWGQQIEKAPVLELWRLAKK